MAQVKGMCYGNDAFPAPYNESEANQTQVFFGSDNAADYMKGLWGDAYRSSTGAFCQPSQRGQPPYCRSDLNAIGNLLGAELIRLYDWDPRNPHQPFLDACQQLSIGVLVSVSDYFIQPGGGLPNKDQNIPALIKSYSNSSGTNYHPAVEGVVIGNEFNGYSVDNLVEFTKRWFEIEGVQFGGYRPVQIGHPISFALVSRFPCWDIWDQLLPPLSQYKSRLFLAPNTYNDAEYLFQNAENSGRGYVDVTYDQYQMPIWFTEIGLDRSQTDHVSVVKGQLIGCINYAAQNPQKLIGCCFFSYADKVWMQGQTDKLYGTLTHSRPGQCTITYSDSDFTHRDYQSGQPIPLGTLNIDVCTQTDLWDAVRSCYVSG